MSHPGNLNETVSGVRDGETIVFTNTGTFAANSAAEDWLSERGYSVGTMQRGAPRAIFRGDCCIAKWRNLSREEQRACDGLMTGNFRDGPVTVRLADTSERPAMPREEQSK